MKIGKILFYTIYMTVFVGMFFLMGGGKFLGYESLIVQSGSMEPEIPVGSVVIVNKNKDYASLEKGNIIVFSKGEDRVTHRVSDISEEGIETKGDANAVSDGVTTTKENFYGEVVAHIPKIGFLLAGKGRILFPIGMALIYIIWATMINTDPYKAHRRYGTME